MAFTTPTTEPDTLSAGITWEWEKTLSDYPPSEGWTLTYYLTGATSLSFAAEADPTDTVYSVSVPAATTASVTAGTYKWFARVDDGAGTVREADSGTFVVLADPNIADGTDARTHSEKMLARVESEIEARLTGDGSGHTSYSIGGRSLAKYELSELQALAGQYRYRVWRERNPGKSLPSHYVTFNAAE